MSLAGTSAIAELWAKVKALVATKSAVSVTRRTTSGTNIADITIDGTTTKLYAPTGGGGSYTAGDGIEISGSTISRLDTFPNGLTLDDGAAYLGIGPDGGGGMSLVATDHDDETLLPTVMLTAQAEDGQGGVARAATLLLGADQSGTADAVLEASTVTIIGANSMEFSTNAVTFNGNPPVRVVNVSLTTSSISVNNGVSNNLSLASYVPDGYKAVGIVGVQTNHGQNWYSNDYINVSTQRLYYNIKHAFGSAAETLTIQWKVLCVPSALYG